MPKRKPQIDYAIDALNYHWYAGTNNWRKVDKGMVCGCDPETKKWCRDAITYAQAKQIAIGLEDSERC